MDSKRWKARLLVTIFANHVRVIEQIWHDLPEFGYPVENGELIAHPDQLATNDIYYLANSYEHEVQEDLDKGYIKELQEPKWTDQDMIEFIDFYEESKLPLMDKQGFLIEFEKINSTKIWN